MPHTSKTDSLPNICIASRQVGVGSACQHALVPHLLHDEARRHTVANALGLLRVNVMEEELALLSVVCEAAAEADPEHAAAQHRARHACPPARTCRRQLRADHLPHVLGAAQVLPGQHRVQVFCPARWVEDAARWQRVRLLLHLASDTKLQSLAFSDESHDAFRAVYEHTEKHDDDPDDRMTKKKTRMHGRLPLALRAATWHQRVLVAAHAHRTIASCECRDSVMPMTLNMDSVCSDALDVCMLRYPELMVEQEAWWLETGGQGKDVEPESR
ncbi:hypothetical protein BC826DRAFT_972028 [Russula brevipes]|nr:hypothetical protein BC826DRAFT_972028 [Russula brevipes]